MTQGNMELDMSGRSSKGRGVMKVRGEDKEQKPDLVLHGQWKAG